MHIVVGYSHVDLSCSFFFFNDTATTEIYTLSLHDALPICSRATVASSRISSTSRLAGVSGSAPSALRSEEHTSELQSPCNLVCRLLLEKKKHLCQTTTFAEQQPAMPAASTAL